MRIVDKKTRYLPWIQAIAQEIRDQDAPRYTKAAAAPIQLCAIAARKVGVEAMKWLSRLDD
jgi:hypothetical protein